ncbi:postreplication repair E3 ubiquitin-protein ligase RAD18-like [Iris pallida]|uniref:E3 ubiquitin-protein ligase RMA n=1 Tax=Iris pallida TaxID=29817 RepID=A0AAX6H1N8_IRIPA|nr:postreplication repair E3 ubiquitin-protein ligase RAD18-like [Iris pallida]
MRKRKASSAKVDVLKEKEKSEGAPDFECNICLELAIEPVVTCCGHLFCWPCLYQWLHVHCYYQECPVCKGKVDDSSIVPIYGRGSLEATAQMQSEKDGNLGLKVPPRPQGNRVESMRLHLQSRPLRGPATSPEHLRVLFEDEDQGGQFVPVEGRNPWDLARHSSPNSQISASSSFHQDGAASQQRAAIDGSISRFSSILAEIRSLSRISDEPVENAPADNQRDFEPVVSQTSNSSTMAMILGNNAAIDTSVEPSRGGSSMLLRVRARRRSTPVVSRSNTAADGASDGSNSRLAMVLRRRGWNSTSVVQGDTSAETNASSAEPSRGGGFTMVLRRGRGRSSDSSSMDHVGQRRRLD